MSVLCCEAGRWRRVATRTQTIERGGMGNAKPIIKLGDGTQTLTVVDAYNALFYHPGISGPAYKHSAGAYRNMIPWHVCAPVRDFAGEQLVKQAQRCALRIAAIAKAVISAEQSKG